MPSTLAPSSRYGCTPRRRRGIAMAICCLAGGAAAASPPPADTDRAAIERVLSAYTTAVSAGDEPLFAGLLLDDRVPFFSVGRVAMQPATLTSERTRDYPRFRDAIFRSGRRYHQRFDRIAIEHRGSLATASLHFVTLRADGNGAGGGGGGEGWKALTLLKVGERWKIASEFYTVAPIGAAAGDAAGVVR